MEEWGKRANPYRDRGTLRRRESGSLPEGLESGDVAVRLEGRKQQVEEPEAHEESRRSDLNRPYSIAVGSVNVP